MSSSMKYFISILLRMLTVYSFQLYNKSWNRFENLFSHIFFFASPSQNDGVYLTCLLKGVTFVNTGI